MIYFCIASAHYDTDVHHEPEVLDLDRTSAHLGFGLGPHYCVGAPLARIEVRAALDAMFDRFPTVRPDPDQPLGFRYGARGFVRHGADSLAVLLGQRS